VKVDMVLESTTREAILDKLYGLIPPIAKSVSLLVFVSERDLRRIKKRTEKWMVSFGGAKIPVECSFVFDDEEKVRTAVVSVIFPSVVLMVSKDHEAYQWLKAQTSQIATFGSFDDSGSPAALRLILNSDRGLEMYQVVGKRYPELSFTVEESDENSS